MSLSYRKVRFWLADRYPALDTPTLYRPVRRASRASLTFSVRVLLGVASVALLLVGLAAGCFALFVLVAMARTL